MTYRITLPGGGELETDGTITSITDERGAEIRLHVPLALSRLVERWRKPVVTALLTSWATELQAVENMWLELMLAQSPDYAAGAVLDQIGRKVGQARFGFDDDTYRALVRARIAANKSQGKGEDLIAVIEAALPETEFTLTEHPVGFSITFSEPVLDGVAVALVLLLAAARMAGVGWSLTVVPTDVLRCASTVGSVDLPTHTLSSTVGSSTDPGYLASYARV